MRMVMHKMMAELMARIQLSLMLRQYLQHAIYLSKPSSSSWHQMQEIMSALWVLCVLTVNPTDPTHSPLGKVEVTGAVSHAEALKDKKCSP